MFLEKTLIISDASSDLSREEVEGLPIWIAPVRIVYEGVEHTEFYEIDRHQYWKDLERLDEIPTTIMANPDWWIETYNRAAAEGYTHILVHVISSTASGVYNSSRIGARMFAQEHGGNLVIKHIDSRSYAFIYGRTVLEAARMILNGASFERVCERVRWLTERNNAALWVYSLKHLKRSGRISGMTAFVGETLGLRPVLIVRDGYIEPVERVRGDKNLVPRAVEWVRSRIINPEEQTLVILHAAVPREELERTESLLRESVRPKDVIFHEIGCSVTTNTGPAVIAVAFYGEPFTLADDSE